MNNNILLLVHNVVGFDSFFIKGQRAEIFELADEAVPTFRITIPDESFKKIKNSFKQKNINIMRNSLNEFENEMIKLISFFNFCNFKEIYPQLDSNEFPELNINEKGFPNLDTNEILTGFKLNEHDYLPEFNDYNYNMENDLKLKVFQSNKDFDLTRILTTLANITDFNDKSNYNTITENLAYFKFIKKVDNYYSLDKNFKEKFKSIQKILENSEYLYRISNTDYYIENIQKNLKRILYLLRKFKFSNISSTIDFRKKYPELKINNDGYADFNINDIMKGYNFYFKKYININYFDKFRNIFFTVLQSNQKFDLLNILIDLSNIMEFSNFEKDNELTRRLIYYKFIIKNDDNTYNFNMESMIYFLKKYYNNEANNDDEENEIYNLYFDEDESKYMLIGIDDSLYDSFSYLVKSIIDESVKVVLENILKFNFKKNNLYFMKEEFPELKIGEDGYPKFSISDVEKVFKYKYSDYPSVDHKYNLDDVKLSVYQWNKDFRLVNILKIIANSINFKNSYFPNEFLKELAVFKFVELNKNNIFVFDEENYNLFMEEWEITEDNNKKFKTKDSSMIVEINGQEKKFKKVTFSLGGKYSRSYSKPQYNIKIRGKDELFGRTQFKLRSDTLDPSYMKTKIISDVHNRLGIPSLSANYISLYINDEFMGLYILTDRYKLSWIEYVYGEKDSISLYKCDHSTLTYNKSECENENENVTDSSEWNEFIQSLDNAQSISDVENFFDVDQFLKEMAIEYLFGSWDHIENGHNYFMFKPKNGKWQYLLYDFDLDFDSQINENINEYIENNLERIHLVKILDLKNSSRFKNIVKEIVTEVFNPATLYPHIDHIKEFIRPYVIQDKTLTPLGYYPGRINDNNDFCTFDQWEANCEFTTVENEYYNYGIKYWILERYRQICNFYDMECDPLYMDRNYEYPGKKDEKEDEDIYSITATDESEISTSIYQDESSTIAITLTKTITKVFTKTIDELITPFPEEYY